MTRIEDDPLAAAQALAAEIAARSPDAIRRAKRLATEVPTLAAADGLALEAELQKELLGRPNQIAAVTAAMSGQPAEFVDRVKRCPLVGRWVTAHHHEEGGWSCS